MMDYNDLYYPYGSRRMTVYAKKGMVAASQPLASQAGIEILKRGGNAVDAAIATAACLTVVEPTSNGIGGDAFAIVWFNNKMYGLNASGPSPKGISIQSVKKSGYTSMPKYGWVPVNVPGIPSAWASLSEHFGKLPLTEVLKPAIEYAECGYPVSPVVSKNWKTAFDMFQKDLKDDMYKHLFETFAPQGRTPKTGEVWRSKDIAKTLQLIAETKAKAFYSGQIAEKIDAFSRKYGGCLRKEDLEGYKPEWMEPVSINYRGYDVWELPPNGHGIVVLMALNILKGFEFGQKDSIDTCHKQIEAMKLAYADGKSCITDPCKMKAKVEDLLSDGYAYERRRLIGAKAIEPLPARLPSGGTVYFAVADGEGNMVSYIQSNYMDFGSGLVVPGTGIALHNRGNTFSLDSCHANCLEPGKRTYHTIIPGFLTKGGKAVGPFGVMGKFMQPQGHVQVLMNSIDFGLNPQAALDAPRWQWIEGRTVEIEPDFPNHIAGALSEYGHDIRCNLDRGVFGRGQIIWKNEDGVLCGGTEPRADGAIAAW